MIPIVKYVLLTKEVDYKGYFFLFNQTDLELIKETGNFYIFKNKHAVSSFYQSPSPEPRFLSLSLLPYTQTSPVEFSEKTEAEYIMFVPPSLDSDYWGLEGKPSLAHGFYALYPAREGTIHYRRFDTYLLGYAVSLLTLMALASGI
ncbi:MAG: hypothetical protein KKA10_18025 [Euryarchaeota archaeon]|nr:hypothetical protein [Euryarchaeota archaeon]